MRTDIGIYLDELKNIEDQLGTDKAKLFTNEAIKKFTLNCLARKQVKVEPEVKVNFAEIVGNVRKKIGTSLEEFYKENPESRVRIEYHKIVQEAGLWACDELLKEYNSKISA